MTPSFWRDKRVFITGHTGFKGSWLALWLTHCGAKVVGYALDPPTEPNLYETIGLAEKLISIKADIQEQATLTQAVADHRPDLLFHLAAQPLVRQSYRAPVATYMTNIMGTVHLLEAARLTPSVRVVVVITSDKCYANQELERGYHESDPMGGDDPYSSSKGCAELVASAYGHSFLHQTALATARAGNVIGGGDWALDRIVPDTIRAFMAQRTVTIRNPHATRPWQHVLEPLSGYLRLAEALWDHPKQFAGGWNFGPKEEDALPVSDLVEQLSTLWGAGGAWQIQPGAHPHEAHRLQLDCAKAAAQLGWQPRWTIQEALSATVEWYQAYARGDAMRPICLNQIERYQASP